MRAAVLNALIGPDGVQVVDVPDAAPGPDQVLVDVDHAGVVFPDVLRTRGEYQARSEPPFILGWEVAGVVREDSCGFAAGDRVAAMPGVGGFADAVAVDAHMVFPLPDEVSLRKGAAVPLNYLTMHFALVHRAGLRRGEIVLVHGAAGGLGTAACQLASALGARVIAVVSDAAKEIVARAAGATDVVRVAHFRRETLRLTGGRGVDIVVDPVGGDRFTDSLRSLAVQGRLIVLGFAGRQIPTVKVNRLLLTNTSVIGAASEEFWQDHPNFPQRQWRELVPLLRTGRLDPIVGAVHPLDQVREALRSMDERRVAGRVLLEMRRPLPERA